jgi:murein L,D-transpeptidase YafK
MVNKKNRTLEVFDGEKLIKTYKIALGFEPIGDKIKQGDGRTPEGEFYVAVKNPNSKFYLSLGLSYPNAAEAERGLKSKLISQKEYDAILAAIKDKKQPPQNTALGGDIYIHGGGTDWDWTWGCIALENEQVKELFDALEAGTPVTVKP